MEDLLYVLCQRFFDDDKPVEHLLQNISYCIRKRNRE